MTKIDWGHWTPHKDGIPDDAIGFVYRITQLDTGKFYIGCKQLYKTIKRKPLKGKKRRRISQADSDWRNYYSSSGVIKEDIEKNHDKYSFEILSFHPNKTTLKIEETRQIIENIYNDKCFNEMVNIRLRVKK